jgi:carbon monoxide dehydrogenase subunit G
MLTAEASETVTRAPSEVFAFLGDVRNEPRWHTDVLEATLVQGSTDKVGSVYEIKVKPVLGISGGTVTLSEYSPPSKVVYQVDMGKMKPTTTFTVQPEGAGARVTRKVEMEPSGMMRLMAPMMGGMFRKRNVMFVANLKRALESPSAP